MFSLLATTAAAALMASAAPQIDMATVQKWSRAEVASYHVGGVYSGWTGVSHQWAAAEGDVKDSLKVDFTWNLNQRKVVGDVKFSDGASSVGALRSSAKECPPPGRPGSFELFTTKSAAQDGGQPRIALKGERAYGQISVPLECPASLKLMTSPAKKADVTLYLAIPDPRMLGVGETGSPNVSVSKDHKTFTVTADGWTWTYTPTLVK